MVYFNKYTCVKSEAIGSGSAGFAFLIQKNGTKFVLKKQKNNQRSQIEQKVLSRLINVKNVVQLVDSREISDMLLMVIEYGSQGSVIDYLDTSNYLDSYGNVLLFFQKILVGIKGVIAKGIIHSDLKLDNIVVDKDDNPIIIDFDLAVEKDDWSRGRGTLSYASPEILIAMMKHEEIKYTEAIDVYSLGVIFYAMLTGELPFEIRPSPGKNLGSMLVRSELLFDPGLPRDAMDIVLICLQKKESRGSLSDLMKRVGEAIDNPSHKVLKSQKIYTMEKMRLKQLRTNKSGSNLMINVTTPNSNKLEMPNEYESFLSPTRTRTRTQKSELDSIFQSKKVEIDDESTQDNLGLQSQFANMIASNTKYDGQQTSSFLKRGSVQQTDPQVISKSITQKDSLKMILKKDSAVDSEVDTKNRNSVVNTEQNKNQTDKTNKIVGKESMLKMMQNLISAESKIGIFDLVSVSLMLGLFLTS